MFVKNSRKAKIIIASAFLLAVLSCLTLFCAKALSENVENIISRIEYMQRVDISPAWLPDISANEKYVEETYNLYIKCSDEEKAEFSDKQNQLLKEYFTALFKVQNKDTAEIDSLFAGLLPGGESAAPTQSPESTLPPEATASPEASPSQSPSPSPLPTASPQQSPSPSPAAAGTDTESEAPQPTAGATSVIADEIKGGKSWLLTLLENNAAGMSIIIILTVLLIIIVIYFFIEIRKTRIYKNEDAENQLEKELFGEFNGPEIGPEEEQPQISAKPLKAKKEKKSKKAAESKAAGSAREEESPDIPHILDITIEPSPFESLLEQQEAMGGGEEEPAAPPSSINQLLDNILSKSAKGSTESPKSAGTDSEAAQESSEARAPLVQQAGEAPAALYADDEKPLPAAAEGDSQRPKAAAAPPRSGVATPQRRSAINAKKQADAERPFRLPRQSFSMNDDDME